MYRQISIWKRIIYGILATVMVLTSCDWGTIFIAAEALGNPSGFQVGFGTVLSGGATLTAQTNDGVGSFYMITKQQQTLMTVNIRPDFQTGYVKGQDLEITLPYLYWDEKNVLVQVNSFDKIPSPQKENGEYIGIEAKLNNMSVFGNSADIYNENGDKIDSSQYARGKIELRNSYEPLSQDCTPQFDIQFYTASDKVTIPENTAATLNVKFSYDKYYDNSGNELSGRWSTDELDSEQEKQARTVTFVNSNLEWSTSIKSVPTVQLDSASTDKSTAVMWQKYNYMVYEVTVQNDSAEKESTIDNYLITLQAQYNPDKMRSILDEDILRWCEDDTNTPNTNISADFYQHHNFVGKPNEGGVLIYDVTNTPDWKTQWDLENFTNLPGETMSYGYSGTGTIILQREASDKSHMLYSKEKAEELNQSDPNGKYYAARKYMVAIPYPNNFNSNTGFKNTSGLTTTISFGGGSSIHWSKQGSDTTEFTPHTWDNFAHHKYVKDADGKEVTAKTVGIGAVDEYYLDGFNSIGNIPVFNAVATDHVPEDFDLQEIQINLQNDAIHYPDIQLKDWFKVDGTDLNQFIQFGFTDENGDVVYKTADELGLGLKQDANVSAADEKIWTLAIGDALTTQAGLTFCNEVKFVFREEIPRYTNFNGLITMRGAFPHLWTYDNKIDTSYEIHYYQPPTASEDGEGKWVSESKDIDEKNAVIKTEQAKPALTGVGVYDDSIGDLIQKGNPQTVSLNDDTAAARFVISNDSISEISPATLDITGLYPDEDYTAGGLVASNILLSKSLLEKTAIEKIVLHGKVNNRGTLTDLDITLDKLESYGTNANGDLEIPKSAWSGKLTYLTGMTVYFQRISDNIPLTDANDDGNCYVQIHGTPTTEKDITPHGVLKTDYSFGEHDQTALDQTVEDIVVLNVSKVLPELKASVHAIRKDGTEAYKEQSVSYDKNGNAHPVYPTLAVPNRSETEQTWYQFLLTNNSRSTSSHALLQVNMDSVGNEPIDCLQDVEGFDTRKIVLDGIGTGRAAEIDRIELFDWNNTTYTADNEANIKPSLTVDSDALTVDADGNVTYTVPDTIQRLRSVRIIFSRIYGNADLDNLKEMNLKLYGSTDWTGDLKASAHFEVIGSINEASKTSSEATMQVAKTNLQITPSANRPETQESDNKSLTVPNKANDLYYGFLLENGATSGCYSKAGKSLVSVDLQSVGVKTEKDSAKIVKGYLTDKVTISSNYAKSGVIESVKLTAFLPDGIAGPKQVKTFTLEELEKSKNAAGELEMDLSDWKARDVYLANIEIAYADLERDLSAEQGNAPELRIYGTSNWFDDLTAKMTVTPQHELMQDQATSASVKFHVDRPGLSVNTHIYYNDQKESTRAASGNTDGNETIFGVPYDRDFMLRAEFANETISVLDDTQIIAKIPYEKQGEEKTGFHTTKLRIYQDLIDQFGAFDNIILTGKDAENQEKTVTLLPKIDENGKLTGFYTKDAPDTVYTYTDGALTFTRDTDTRLFPAFGIKNLTQVELNGRLVKLVDKTASEKRYIEFDGYDDSLFGKTDTLEVETHNYLDGFRESKGYVTEPYDKDKYIVTKKDTTAIYVSKMYFDTTVMAFYKDADAGDKKYTAAASAVEHLRKKYAQPTENMRTCYWMSTKHIDGADGYLFSESKWGDSADNSELEIGYKSIGSFAVDFRQYLNTGNNLPKAKPTLAGQEHQSYDYVRNASLNTAATVDITLDLPSNTFDAYYLKIDPRAKDYIKSVTAIYADGTKRIRSGQEIRYEANESNTNGNFARLNLLGSDADMFSEDDSNYYKKPESYDGKEPENPVKQVVVTIDINRYQTVNNDGKTAKSPDYGTWYDQTDSSTQGMFEVTGRFYRMDEAVAKAHADVTVGNTTDDRSKVRTDSGAKKEKSEWSFTDQYYAWTPNHSYSHGHYWTYEIFDYTAKHLQSSTRVHIVNDQDNVQKGVGETPGTAENRNAEFGQDNSFAIRFYRQGRTTSVPTSKVNAGYSTSSRSAPNNNEYHWTMSSPYVRTDQYDWVNKLSFTDKVVLSDSLPQIRPDDDYEYKGFLTTGIQIKKEIYQYFRDDDNIIFTINAKNTNNDVVGSAQTISVPVSELRKMYGETEDWNIYFEYTPRQQDNTDNGENANGSTEEDADDADTGADEPQIEPTYTLKTDDGKYVVVLGEDTFVTDYSMTMYDIPGTGDYSAELTDKEKADYHNQNAWDILVQGKPYAINKTDRDMYGENTAKTSVSTDYAPDKEIYSQSDNATIMGYLIDFKAGYALQTKSGTTSEKLYYDYDQTDNNTPNRGLFQVKLFNQDKQNATGQEAAARINSAATTNTMDGSYRLEHIYLPAFLLDGDWFGVENLTLRVGSTDVPVNVVKGIGVDGMADGIYVVHVDTTKNVQGEEVYTIDVEQILRQLYQANSSVLGTYTNSTNQKTYVKAYVSSFQLDLKAKKADRNDSSTVLGDGEYLSADKSKDKSAFLYDGVYVDRTPDDFTKDDWNSNSTPSFGKSPNGYPEQTPKNQLSAIFTSVDPNANTYVYKNTDGTAKGSKKEASYTVKNLTGTLDAVVTRTRMYDQDSKTDNIDKVDYLHLTPYDYVEYTIQVGAPSNALIPLEHTTVDFSVPKGQRIVRWDVVDANGNIKTDGNAAENIPAADIHATLSDGGTAIEAAQGVKYALLAKSDADPEETAYKRLVAELGKGAKSDDQIKPGETVYLRVTTQLTENGGSYDNVTVGTPDLKIHAAPKHGYPQYSIYDTANGTNYTPNTDRQNYRWNKRVKDDAGYSYYYRYTEADADKQTQYYAHVQNELTYQSVAPVKLTYQVNDAEQNYDGKGAVLTVSDLYNETGHYCDTYTIDVSFLEKRSKNSGDVFYRGFELTKPYTVSEETDKFDRVEMLYAVAEPSTNPRFAEDENIAFKTNENGVKVTWKSYEYDPSITTDQAATAKMTDDDLPNVIGVRWVYYDLKGFDTTTAYSSTSKTKVALQNVTLTGVGRYQDVTDGTGVKADTYKQYFTATNTYEHIHSENENAVTVTESGSSVASTATPTEHTVKLSDSTVLNPSVYRENPIASFHTQTFSSESDASAAYDEKKTQKISYRPGDTIWQKVTLKNNLAALSSGKQAGEEGRLINPVIYDKVPEYFAKTLYDSYGVGASIPNFHFHLRLLNANGSEKDLSNIELYLANKTAQNGYDYGGKMTYTDGFKSTNATQKAFNDLNPDENSTYQISFTVYELRLRYKDAPDADFVLQPGEQIEFCYSATIRENDLPMVYTASTYANDTAASTVDGSGLHPAYFPRIGEYYQQCINHHYSWDTTYGKLYPTLTGGFSSDGNTWNNFKQVQNSNIQMDMDYLMHDIGFSADKNTQVDMWEFLDQTITHIPGSGSTDATIGGQNDTLLDEDSQTAKNMQTVKYNASSKIDTADQLSQLPQTVKYMAGGANRDWFRLAMGKRNKDYVDWANLDAAKNTPVVWSETRLHLQKAWLATSSEFVTSNIQYEKTNGDRTNNVLADPNYPYYGTYSDGHGVNSYYNSVHEVTDRSGAAALEYDEDVKVQLQAYNYGDWDLDGVTFLYTYAYGMKPVMNADGTLDTSEILAYTNTGDSKANTFSQIDGTYVTAEIIQKPGDKNPQYLAPKAMRDAAQNANITDGTDGYYTADEYTPYVVKITVKQPLKKWYGRGSGFGYITRVTLPARVYTDTASGTWYDRVLTQPYVAEGSQNHLYYQIYDIDHWDGSTKALTKHNQLYGMDYLWSPLYFHCDTANEQLDSLKYLASSPNMPSVNGYNIQNKETVEENGSYHFTNNDSIGRYSSGTTMFFAETGTRAVQRKPLVRSWATISETIGKDEMYGKTVEQYYTETQGEVNWINVHVENNYYWDEYGYSGSAGTEGYNNEKSLHSYGTDGGQKGSLSLPVITNILPYGIVPVAADGSRYTTDNDKNNKPLNWELYDKDATTKLTDQMALYDTEVYYDDSTKRYVVQIFAKEENDTEKAMTAAELAEKQKKDAAIRNGSLYNFCIKTFTYAEPDDVINGVEEEDLLKNYLNNYSYVSSRVNAYRFITDNDIPENPYTVCSAAVITPLINTYYTFDSRKPDKRKDAVAATASMKRYYHGTVYYYKSEDTLPMRPDTDNDGLSTTIPDSYVILKHKFEKDGSYMLGSMSRYAESDSMEMDEYRKDKPLYERIRSALNRDVTLRDNGSDMTFQDITSANILQDAGVVNTLKIRTQTPSLKAENMVAAEKADTGLKGFTGDTENLDEVKTRQQYQNNGKDFDYSDILWYSAKVSSQSEADYRYRGSIFHAKMVVTFQLPENVRYWDEDDLMDDYYLEYTDKSGAKQTLTMAQARDDGWGIELTQRYFAGDVAPAENTTDGLTRADSATKRGGETLVFKITTPAEKGFNCKDDKTYVAGYHPAGYFNGTLNFKIKTRIDNLELQNDTDSSWEDYYSKVYVTFEQTDGKFAITKDGLFAERDADGKYYTRGGCLMPKQDENGYVYNDYGNIVYEKKQR